MQVFYDNIGDIDSYLREGRYLLVCGNSFDKLPIKEFITKFDIIRFSEFSPNPKYDEVVKGVEKFVSGTCNGIIAVGGGSAIDVAKCIKLFSGMNENKSYLEQTPSNNRSIPFIAIPTTAGTGSESTKHAVIYYEGSKQSISYDEAIPDTVVLIPELLKNVPIYQKKSTLLDALCQGLESWWSINSTSESIEYAKEAVYTILDNYKNYLNGDEDSTRQILSASNYSGKAINITATTAPHAMSYKLTSLYGIPHGIAVALCMPGVWEYMVDNIDRCKDRRGKEYLKKIFDEIPINADKFRDILSELDISKPISKNKENDIVELVASINQERLKNSPVDLDSEAIFRIYNDIIVGVLDES